MATWNSGVKFQFRDEHSVFAAGSFHSYAWSYNTASDMLIIECEIVPTQCGYGQGTDKGKYEEFLYGQEQAKALYKTLRHWIWRFCGTKELETLDKEAVNGRFHEENP
jgi:hypothetical protein